MRNVLRPTSRLRLWLDRVPEQVHLMEIFVLARSFRPACSPGGSSQHSPGAQDIHTGVVDGHAFDVKPCVICLAGGSDREQDKSQDKKYDGVSY